MPQYNKKYIKTEDLVKSCNMVTLEEVLEAKAIVENISEIQKYFKTIKRELLNMLDSTFKNISSTLPYQYVSHSRWFSVSKELKPKTGKNVPKKSMDVYKEIEKNVNLVLEYTQKHWASYNCVTGEKRYISTEPSIYAKHVFETQWNTENRISTEWNSIFLVYLLADTQNVLNATKIVLTMMQETKEKIDSTMAKIKDVLIVYQ